MSLYWNSTSCSTEKKQNKKQIPQIEWLQHKRSLFLTHIMSKMDLPNWHLAYSKQWCKDPGYFHIVALSSLMCDFQVMVLYCREVEGGEWGLVQVWKSFCSYPIGNIPWSHLDPTEAGKGTQPSLPPTNNCTPPLLDREPLLQIMSQVFFFSPS